MHGQAKKREGPTLDHAPQPETTPVAETGTPSLLTLQRSAGNEAVLRLLGLPTAPLLQRHDVGGQENKQEREKLKQELKELNGLEINALLGALAGKDGHTQAHYRELFGEVAGFTHEERLRACLDAVPSAGASAAEFALAHKGDLTAIGHIDQIDAILRRVGSFSAKPLAPGDKLKTKRGGDGAIYREGKVRIRKDSALTWMAANPGAIGEGPAFKPAGAFSGKTVGGARLSIFPDDATGEAGLLQWIKFNADRGMTVGGFFHAQAPTAEELAARWKKKHPGEEPTRDQMKAWEAATKGNDPKRYLETVAKALGKKPEEISGKPLSSVDAKAVGEAMKQFVEKWVVGDELTVEAAIDDASLPAETRFQLLYTSWAKGK